MKYITIIIFLLSSLIAQAHGEDTPGPHGGFVQMPANFHTEVVVDKNLKTFQVYLLDLKFENASVIDSSLEAVFVQGRKRLKLDCGVLDRSYICNSPVKMKSGTLLIKAKREKNQGVEAKYKLPLKF